MKFDRTPFLLPQVRKVLQTNYKNEFSDAEIFWNAEFYPYDVAENAQPVFAISSNKLLIVYRIIDQATSEVQNLYTFGANIDDESSDNSFIACEWAFIDQKEPLLLGAGDDGLIRVFDITKGNLKTVLLGHGQGPINDLATHPLYPWIVASGSQDASIRIWDLRRWNNRHESPSVIICGHGHGHQTCILSISWHQSGRYLISGAHDHRICVWTLPDLSPESKFWDEISPAQRKRSSDEIRVIHYPHFTSTAIHPGFVDCVRFYGDRVLSRCHKGLSITLWEITGFDSNLTTPDDILAPKTQEHLESRNGFMRTHTILPNGASKFGIKDGLKDRPPYSRLLEFETPDCDIIYLRFALLKPSSRNPKIHPVLAMGNYKSEVMFWDLDALKLGYDGAVPRARKIKHTKQRKGIAQKVSQMGSKMQQNLNNPNTEASASSSPTRSVSLQRSVSAEATPPLDMLDATEIPRIDRERFPLNRPREPIKAQAVVPLKKISSFDKTGNASSQITLRSIAWSLDGKCCVAAGEVQEYFGSWGPNIRGQARTLSSKQESQDKDESAFEQDGDDDEDRHDDKRSDSDEDDDGEFEVGSTSPDSDDDEDNIGKSDYKGKVSSEDARQEEMGARKNGFQRWSTRVQKLEQRSRSKAVARMRRVAMEDDLAEHEETTDDENDVVVVSRA